MARQIGSVCKLCRREGQMLYLKGARCYSSKCAILRRNFQPGQHSWSRGRPSEYGVRLREKQKLKRFFGVSERVFRRVFFKARRQSGNTGENILVMLQRRLDNVLVEAGITLSRRNARQLISHGNIQVNGRRCDIPSAMMRAGDTVSVGARDNVRKLVKEEVEARKGEKISPWLQFDEDKLEAKLVESPKREHLSFDVDEQLVVELMSR